MSGRAVIAILTLWRSKPQLIQAKLQYRALEFVVSCFFSLFNCVVFKSVQLKVMSIVSLFNYFLFSCVMFNC